MVAKTVATTTMKKRHFNGEATTKLKITLLYLKFGNVSFGACTATRIVFATRRTPKPNPKNFTWILSNSRNKYTQRLREVKATISALILREPVVSEKLGIVVASRLSAVARQMATT